MNELRDRGGSVPTDALETDVCVLVVSFNSADHLPALLDSLSAAADGLTLRVVVVDNASSDSSVEVARRENAIVVEAGGNVGYAAGINVGRPWARGCRAILVANPDLRFSPGAIRLMYTGAVRSDSVVVPLLRGPENEVRRSLRREPTVTRQLGEALLGDRWPTRPAWLAIMVREKAAYHAPGPVDWATGAALMIPRGLDARVGSWDERYFLYSEEVDFARRVREAGSQIWFDPRAEVEHAEGGSGRSERLFALDALNRIRYFSTWNGRARSVLYGAAIELELLLRIMRPTHRRAMRDVGRATALVARGKPLPDGRDVMGITGSERVRA